MTLLLEDKTAVVTGGSSGNGRAIGRAFAAEGADIVVADIQETPREGGEPTHELIESESDSSATFVDCDVTSKDDLDAAVEAAEQFGGVDIMVNNAGIFHGEEFLDVDEAAFDQLMDINVKGVFFGSQVAAERMVENGGGSIINLSSVAGLEGSADFITYCTSKGAVRLMTYSLAAKLGPEEIRVNAIHPGLIETKMTTEDVPIIGGEGEDEFLEGIPLGRAGQPEDVADTALYLASDLASYVSGESLVLDGGMTNTQ
ncbi:SDR family oxidoreductase [Natronoarchaeum sp. GCM10025703]|uniref:SDR family oxidoreductase n=1 Tax=unclassified Natronoarchaeum TaxID=2620183 RepID=UPI00361E9900